MKKKVPGKQASRGATVEYSPSVSTDDVMARLEQQEQVQLQKDIASGRLVPETTMQDLLKLSAQGLSEALNAKRIFAIRSSSHGNVYPAFFGTPSLDRGGARGGLSGTW